MILLLKPVFAKTAIRNCRKKYKKNVTIFFIVVDIIVLFKGKVGFTPLFSTFCICFQNII